MELVTGRGGEDHISSADIASMLRGVYSDADVVLPLDDDLALTILSANSAQVGKGGCMLQGHFARVETAEQLVIESGAPGFNRNDLIVARYTLGDNNIQAVYLAVIKGTAVAGTASDPAYVDGSIDDGDTLVEFPLWRVPIAGVNVGTPERIMPTVDTLQSQIAANDADIASLRDSVSQVSNIPLLVSGETVLAKSYFPAGTSVTSFCQAGGYTPSDSPDNNEGAYFAFRMTTSPYRCIVVFFGFNTSGAVVYVRSIFNSSWLGQWLRV